MADLCGDNRFELIEKYKQKLIEETNIESAPDEMKVLDNILFRFWQMDWLDKLEQPTAQQWISCSSTKRPKDREEVMVTIDDGYQRYTDMDEYVNGRYWYHDNKQVVAWKPFDEPWKGEQG